jgi:hypothetical protein
LTESNFSKPCIFISNYGTTAVSNINIYYYFSVENSKIPILEQWYTAGAVLSLENLNNGHYAIKINLNSITIEPSNTFPDPNGILFGLHYSDWSEWDKTNDYSNTNLNSFSINGNVAAYDAAGNLIYGDPFQTLPSPPELPFFSTGIGDFAVLSVDVSNISDRVQIRGGAVGSNSYVEIGCDAVVNGTVFSNGSVMLRERSHIYNDVKASNLITEQNYVTIGGTKENNIQVKIPVLEIEPVIHGVQNITVPDSGRYTLHPGSYNNFHAFSNSIITIMPGEYSFNQFITEPNTEIIIKATGLERIKVKISNKLSFADRSSMHFENDSALPYSVKFYSIQTDQVFIGNSCNINGCYIMAPNAEVHVYSNSNLNGAIYGKRVVLEPDVQICKPPLLNDLWHSEWAFSPPFLQTNLDITAVVPDITNSVTITPEGSQGAIVKVNGNDPEIPVNLTGVNTDVSIVVSNVENCGTSAYQLKITKAIPHQIYVNINSPCSPGSEDGNSWSTAFKELQPAINKAVREGKEIWIAEGIYKPTFQTDANDPRSATFMIYSGIEIKGGYKGTETEDKPEGSLYNTILSGDISGNDYNAVSWPPNINDMQYFMDNVYHVVTITGNVSEKAIHLERLLIKSGFASSTNFNDSKGAGIYAKQCYPTLEFVAVQHCFSILSGAGIYAEKGIKSITNCLFKSNVTITGTGAGIYYAAKTISEINGSVFDGNITEDTTASSGGSALRCIQSNIKIVNSIFTKNVSRSNNGTILNESSSLELTNCTFASNASVGPTGITNRNNGNTSIRNTILWNDNSKNELGGANFIVQYSCITNGYTGTGNTSSNPLFTDGIHPAGGDGKYGTADDGLKLTETSPCKENGNDADAPPNDIVLVNRPAGPHVDIGAYEYLDVNKTNKMFLGTLYNGVFIPNDTMVILPEMIHTNEIYQFSGSNFQRIIRAYVEKNKYTDRKDEIYCNIQMFDPVTNSPFSNELRINLKKVGEEGGLLIYQTFTSDYTWGKKVLFIRQEEWHNFENPWAYLIYTGTNPSIHFYVPYDQFN